MKNYYSIGEVAKIFDVSIDTFRYYDKINLIKPFKISNNKHRSYSITQFEMISTVILLKSSGMPLSKISEIINNETPEIMIKELEKLKKDMKSRILEMKLLENRIDNHLDNMKSINNLHEIEVVDLPEIWMLKNEFDESNNLDLQLIADVMGTIGKDWISHANTFTTVSKESLLKGEFHTYKLYGYVSEASLNVKSKNVTILPKRKYITMIVKSTCSNLTEMDNRYEELINYINKNGYQIIGDAIERGILDLLGKDGYINFYKIYIPIEKK